MLQRPTRSLLLVLTILALLMPRVSAVAASVAPGVRTVVICTGQGLQTLRIDEDGKPVPGASHPDHCVLAHSADTASRTEVPAPFAPVVGWVPRRSGDLVRAEGYRTARPPPRGPPAA